QRVDRQSGDQRLVLDQQDLAFRAQKVLPPQRDPVDVSRKLETERINSIRNTIGCRRGLGHASKEGLLGKPRQQSLLEQDAKRSSSAYQRLVQGSSSRRFPDTGRTTLIRIYAIVRHDVCGQLPATFRFRGIRNVLLRRGVDRAILSPREQQKRSAQ